MPRPGPRPYECVRRAWHSDRHQPIRGTLIQEIFRLANEVHSPTTRSNKEWLEKLPLVVFKAEEIIYSKANSEAEYTDLKTLWDRTSDAIDTIIRRDDTLETEADLLQPCIEAALNLGCIPRRSSRSQRNEDPGCYLSSINKSYPNFSSSMLLQQPQLPPPHSNTQNNFFSQLEFSSVVASHSLSHDDSLSCPRLGRVYTLHYGNVQPKVMHDHDKLVSSNPCSLPPICEDGAALPQDFVGNDNAKGAADMNVCFGEAYENPAGSECDLSLRLGLFSPPQLDRGNGRVLESEDVGSSSSCSRIKYSSPSSSGARAVNFESSFLSSREKCFGFFPVESADEPFESCSSKLSSEEEGNFVHQAFR